MTALGMMRLTTEETSCRRWHGMGMGVDRSRFLQSRHHFSKEQSKPLDPPPLLSLC